MSEANQIEGVPEGWRLVGFRHARHGEDFLGVNGLVDTWNYIQDSINVYAVVERIKPSKPKYRPFANAEEFKPHRDRWWYFKDDQRNHRRPAASYDDIGISAWDWKEMLERAFFEDGTPFGIEVKE
jgi:hypothetical protein